MANLVFNQSRSQSQKVVAKSQFWHTYRHTLLNPRQVVMFSKLWGGFYGKLTTKKWAGITKVSTDTALRGINDLVEKGILVKPLASGRSQSYELNCLVG